MKKKKKNIPNLLLFLLENNNKYVERHGLLNIPYRKFIYIRRLLINSLFSVVAIYQFNTDEKTSSL